MNAAAAVDCRKICPEEYNMADAHSRDLVMLAVVVAAVQARSWTLNFDPAASSAVVANWAGSQSLHVSFVAA